MNPILTLPSTKYKNSYLEAIQEFSAKHLKEFEYSSIEEMKSDFDTYVTKIRNYSKGIGLPEGYIPHTEFWLVESGKYIGRLDIRHYLNEFLENVGGNIGYDIRPPMREKGYGSNILKLGLEKAKELGLEKVLLTCTDGNIASEKIILKNGGKFEDSRYHDMHKVYKKRFWIDLGSQKI